VRVTKRPKKDKERNLTVANWVFAETTHVVGNFACMVVLRFYFHQNRLSGFGAVGVEICPSPLTWSLAYTTAYTARYIKLMKRHFPVKVLHLTENMLFAC